MNTAIPHKPHRILILMIILMLVPAMAPAAGPSGYEEEGVPRIRLQTDSVTIAKKGLEKVTTNVGNTYALSRETIIVGLDGHQVSIRKMLVPCDAEISYVTEHGVRKASRIRITRVGDDPNWQWTSDIPE
jgi:hypothetical protein